jgi:Rhodopirellula transposase DDE domain
LIADLVEAVSAETAGNPCSEQRWVRSRLRGLSKHLKGRACPTTIGRLLREQKFGLRSHRKVLHTGKSHAQRDWQFRHLAEQREEFRQAKNPRIRVDAKKKELLGQFKNPGQQWCQEATKVNDHDFPKDAVGRAVPYGVYDPERNTGYVGVTTSHDTADLAVDVIAAWWEENRSHYPQAKELMIEADSGGSNASRSRRFKKRLQEFADASGLAVRVCHSPPGSSKWNPIEHRLFSQISVTWAGAVLSSLLVLLSWIARTTTRTGLRVRATHFDREYPTGMKVTRAEFAAINLTRHDVCPQWNYTIRPHPKNTT